jgi:hypothetical protein
MMVEVQEALISFLPYFSTQSEGARKVVPLEHLAVNKFELDCKTEIAQDCYVKHCLAS